jgi:hypothetical protein
MFKRFVFKGQVLLLKSPSGDVNTVLPISFKPSRAAEEHAQGGCGIYKKCEFAVIVLHYNNPESCEKYIAVLTSVVPSRFSVCFIGRPHRFPASGRGKQICKTYAGIFCDTNKILCQYPEQCV